MTENNIKLVNEDGKIVGKDPETGETIPIEFGEAVIESLSTEEAGIGDSVTLQASADGRLEVVIDND